MTLQPHSYSDLSSPVTAVTAAGTSARQFTEPLRELSVFALLAANAVFLLLGISGLLFVLDRWASDFGLRSAAGFADFVGPLSLGLPMLAMLLATHVSPMVVRVRLVLQVVLAEYAVSAFFGATTFLGAFASDLTSVRATLEGLVRRSVWLALLLVAIIVAGRLWLGLVPTMKRPVPGGSFPTYGRPYPGQPMYPQFMFGTEPVTNGFAVTEPNTEPTTGTSWPVVPPPPMPGPLVVDADPTMRISPLTAAQQELAGESTQIVPTPIVPAPGQPIDSPPQS